MTTSVIVPVYNEPEDTFRRVLESVVANAPNEVVVVVDGGDLGLCALAEPYADCVVSIEHAGKRAAIEAGVAAASETDVVIVLDSDTVWAPGMLRELLKPFADPRVGGVTPMQRITDPRRNSIRRLADWVEDIRYSLAVPAQSVFGQVGCLAGRTIAYRREAFSDALYALVSQRVLGLEMRVGDDRVLTNELLRSGWRTVFQSTALVETEAPDTWRGFWRQQLRWGRSSQRETLLSSRWLFRRPAAALVFWSDLITPFAVFALATVAAATSIAGRSTAWMPHLPLPAVLGLSFLGMTTSIGLRQYPHLRRSPRDVPWLPVFVVQLSLFMVPLRLCAFATMFVNDWGTRAAHDGRVTLRDRRVGRALTLATVLATLAILGGIGASAKASAAERPMLASHAAAQARVLGIAGTSSQYTALSSLHPTARADYVAYGSDLAPSLATDSSLDATAMITWTAVSGLRLSAIVDGQTDAYLERAAQTVRSYSGPVYIRFAQEMNGNWFPWSGNPRMYVAAWRHIWTVFHDAGATNVRWIWGPDLLTNDTASQFESVTARYWPGARYVNVLGPTLVAFTFETNCDISCRFARIDWLHSTFRKPVWLAETKVDAAQRYTWLRSLRTALAASPWVTGVIWSETASRGQAVGLDDSGNMDWR